jgi:RecB family endonuclease NucS
MWYGLTAYRVDVVGHVAGGYEIIEVKMDAGITAVGQLVGYPMLWRASMPGLRLAGVRLVCASVSADIRGILRRLGVEVSVVEI